MNKKRKAYLYQRFSSEYQQGNSSLFRQLEHQTRWLKNNPDVEAEGEPWVDEAVSGRTGAHLKHGQLGRLVEAIENKEIEAGSIILVEQFSRLSRLEVDQTEELLKRIWAGGITIVTAKNSEEYPPSTKRNLALSFKLMFEIHGAYMESEERSNRIKGSYDRRENNAKNDNEIPKIKKSFWLNKDGSLNGKEVVIQDTFKWYKQGLGQQKIRQKLLDKYPNLKDELGNLNPATIMRWIKSKSVIGHWVRYAGTEKERSYKVYDEAVSEELFYEVQGIRIGRLKKNVKAPTKHALSGLMECAYCGGGTSIQRGHYSNALPQIRCSKQLRYGRNHCDFPSTIPYGVVYYYYRQVVEQTLKKLLSDRILRKVETKELRVVESELRTAYRKFKKLSSLFSDADEFNEDILADSLKKSSQEVSNLKQRKIEIEKNLDGQFAFTASEIPEIEKDPVQWNIALNQLGQKIYLSKDKIYFKFPEHDQRDCYIKYLGYSRKEQSFIVEKNYIHTDDLFDPSIPNETKVSWAEYLSDENEPDSSKLAKNPQYIKRDTIRILLNREFLAKMIK